jgi:hypothetical protein
VRLARSLAAACSVSADDSPARSSASSFGDLDAPRAVDQPRCTVSSDRQEDVAIGPPWHGRIDLGIAKPLELATREALRGARLRGVGTWQPREVHRVDGSEHAGDAARSVEAR